MINLIQLMSGITDLKIRAFLQLNSIGCNCKDKIIVVGISFMSFKLKETAVRQQKVKGETTFGKFMCSILG